jgi:hypothetical protein
MEDSGQYLLPSEFIAILIAVYLPPLFLAFIGQFLFFKFFREKIFKTITVLIANFLTIILSVIITLLIILLEFTVICPYDIHGQCTSFYMKIIYSNDLNNWPIWPLAFIAVGLAAPIAIYVLILWKRCSRLPNFLGIAKDKV